MRIAGKTPAQLMAYEMYRILGEVLLGWLVTVSLIFVGYLISLEIADYRKNRRMAARREHLGLSRT